MSEKNAYRLINPYIEGSVETVVRAKNSFNAGKKLYNTISQYFTNSVDNFFMTVQNVETGDQTHFKVNESMQREGNVDFNLTKLEGKFPPEIEEKLLVNVEKLRKQAGGKHHRHRRDDSSSSSSSDSSSDDDDFFRYQRQPINRVVYWYMPYYQLKVVGLNPIDASRIFLPMFSLPINPTMEIRFDLYRI